ncbi:MAG: arginine deiminase family protein [Microscillaceae bacterium]|nr:arginine deiminase family protein [Microscillaceae bacterium]MDW8459798.1 arginine deiminase family protein [Cytophagales bacterium]
MPAEIHTETSTKLYVDTEIAPLRRVMIHSPDSGLERVVPSKAQDWLFEDIIHLDIMRRHEYDYFVKVLLYFLDTEKIKGKIEELDRTAHNREFFKPESPLYFNSDKVIDPQVLLSQLLTDELIKREIVASVCAIERCSFKTYNRLLTLNHIDLAKTLISGALPDKSMIFAPVPNFIFTRDIGIVVKDHLLLNRPAKLVRMRESLIMKYIFYTHPLFEPYRNNIIELDNTNHQFFLSEEDRKIHETTIEGGDVMTISPEQILIGVSERTSIEAVNQVMTQLFERNVVKKVSVIKIPAKRDFMHIDTVFTQVKRNVWVLFGALSRINPEFSKRSFASHFTSYTSVEKPKILQFTKGREDRPQQFDFLEDLLEEITQQDFDCHTKPIFIYSGGNQFPFDLREQWTDSCNLLALKEGVVIGYDRNTKTAEEFKKQGFEVIKARDLLEKFERNETSPQEAKNMLITIPSAELSRARGGSHCMSMPIQRDEWAY